MVALPDLLTVTFFCRCLAVSVDICTLNRYSLAGSYEMTAF